MSGVLEMGQAFLTESGFEKLKRELVHVETTQIKKAEDRIAAAIKKGDQLEIDDAKDEHQFYKGRIQYLKQTLQTAKLIGVS